LANLRFPETALVSTVEELQDTGAEQEEALHVSTARVVSANYALIQHDFPELSTASLVGRHSWLAAKSIAEQTATGRGLIDRWLTENAAFISKSQAAQSVVNTPIATDGTRAAYRPSGYGRALVVPVFADSADGVRLSGLLDIKGAGVSPKSSPRRGGHFDGLDYVGAALSDYALQRLIDEIFRRAVPTCWTVPTYAILDLGFDVVDGWNGTSPAGMHVRRAHRRPHGGMDLPLAGSVEEAVRIQIELLLRNYGLTSASPGSAFDISFADDQLSLRYAGRPITDLCLAEIDMLRQFRRGDESELHLEGINLQLARETGLEPCRAQMVDFGHINVRETFVYPIVNLVRDRLLHIGGIISPRDDHFIQPNPELQVPLEMWRLTTLNDRFFGIADDFRKGSLTSAEVDATVDGLVARAVDRWPQ
jgi:hypothetical protein